MTKRSLNPARFAQFAAIYPECLAQAVASKPEAYGPQVQSSVQNVATKMLAAVETGSYNHNGPSFKLACKRLGIRFTRTAIEAFLAGN
jgi:hypothetical protein